MSAAPTTPIKDSSGWYAPPAGAPSPISPLVPTPPKVNAPRPPSPTPTAPAPVLPTPTVTSEPAVVAEVTPTPTAGESSPAAAAATSTGGPSPRGRGRGGRGRGGGESGNGARGGGGGGRGGKREAAPHQGGAPESKPKEKAVTPAGGEPKVDEAKKEGEVTVATEGGEPAVAAPVTPKKVFPDRNRVATGGKIKEKLTPEELDAKMAAMRIQNEQLRIKRAAEIADESNFAQIAAADKAAADALRADERRAAAAVKREIDDRKQRNLSLQASINAEREATAARKLAKVQGRDWDREKLETGPGKEPAYPSQNWQGRSEQ